MTQEEEIRELTKLVEEQKEEIIDLEEDLAYAENTIGDLKKELSDLEDKLERLESGDDFGSMVNNMKYEFLSQHINEIQLTDLENLIKK